MDGGNEKYLPEWLGDLFEHPLTIPGLIFVAIASFAFVGYQLGYRKGGDDMFDMVVKK